jgi:hypothetical protein
VDTDRLWICRKINFQLKTLTTVTMTILKNGWLKEDEREKVLDVLYNSKKLGLTLKLSSRYMDRVLNSVSAFCNFQIHTNVKKKKSEIKFQTWSRIVRLKNGTFLSVFFSFTKIKIKPAKKERLFSDRPSCL